MRRQELVGGDTDLLLVPCFFCPLSSVLCLLSSVLLIAEPWLLERLEVFARLEANGAAGGYVDFGAGAGVAAYACFAGFYGEDAEAAELDAIALSEGSLHGAEDGVKGRFGLVAGQAGALYDALDEILLDQAGTPFN